MARAMLSLTFTDPVLHASVPMALLPDVSVKLPPGPRRPSMLAVRGWDCVTVAVRLLSRPSALITISALGALIAWSMVKAAALASIWMLVPPLRLMLGPAPMV